MSQARKREQQNATAGDRKNVRTAEFRVADTNGVAHHDWVEAGTVDRLALRDGHGAHRAAVVCALHVDDVGPACDAPSHLEGGLDGLPARRPEEEGVEGGMRHHGQQPLDEL